MSIRLGGYVRLQGPPLSTHCSLRRDPSCSFPQAMDAGLGAWQTTVSLLPQMGGQCLSQCVWEPASPRADMPPEFQSKPPEASISQGQEKSAGTGPTCMEGGVASGLSLACRRVREGMAGGLPGPLGPQESENRPGWARLGVSEAPTGCT